MKKSGVFLALTLTTGAALAQSEGVTIDGIVDAGVSRVTGLAGGSKNALVSGIMEGSRVRIQGREDIGEGYRAIFRLEHRVEVNNGTISSRPITGSQVPDRVADATLLGLPVALQPAVDRVAATLGSTIGVNLPVRDAAGNITKASAFWDRQAWVGLVTPVGAVLLGRQYTPAYILLAEFETMQTQSSLSAGQVSAIPASITIRADNAISYRAEVGPIKASLMYAFGDNPSEINARRLMGINVSYQTDDYGFGGAHNTRNNELGEKSLQSTFVGAYMKLGPGKLSGIYGVIKDDHPDGLSTISPGLQLVGGLSAPLANAVQAAFTEALKQDARQFQIGYKYETGPHTVYVAYNRLDDKRPNDADVDSYGAVYTYSFSKRTDLNFVLTHFNNKNLAQAAPGQAGFLGGVTASAGTNSNNVALGLRHRF